VRPLQAVPAAGVTNTNVARGAVINCSFPALPGLLPGIDRPPFAPRSDKFRPEQAIAPAKTTNIACRGDVARMKGHHLSIVNN
jgi:hypothetical protein